MVVHQEHARILAVPSVKPPAFGIEFARHLMADERLFSGSCPLKLWAIARLDVGSLDQSREPGIVHAGLVRDRFEKLAIWSCDRRRAGEMLQPPHEEPQIGQMSKTVALENRALGVPIDLKQALAEPGVGGIDPSNDLAQEGVIPGGYTCSRGGGGPDKGRPVMLHQIQDRSDHSALAFRGEHAMIGDAAAAEGGQNIGDGCFLLVRRQLIEQQRQSRVVFVRCRRDNFGHCSRQQPGPQGGASEGGQAEDCDRVPAVRAETTLNSRSGFLL